MSYTEVSTTLGAFAAGVAAASITLPVGIRAVASKTGFVRVYDPTLNGTVAADSVNLPQISAATQIVTHSQFDDGAPWYSQPSDSGTPRAGAIDVFPVVPVADTVNAASVQSFKTDSNAVLVYAHD